MKRQTISLCMIVKNEEAHLAQAVGSVQELVDEVVIVDTGSTDATKEIARGVGARVYSFEWQDDFSAARNYSLDQATSDWVLVLDADEYLEQADLKVIKDAVNTSDAEALYLHWRQVGRDRAPFGRHKLNLFRRMQRIRFTGLVHEEVFPSIGTLGWSVIDATIHHLPFEGNAAAKAQFYLRLNQTHYELNGGDERSNFFYGQHLYGAGQRLRAQHHWVLAMPLRRRPFFSFRAAVALALENFERNFDEARMFFEQSERCAAELDRGRYRDLYPEIPGFVHSLRKVFERGKESRLELSNFQAKYF